MARLRSDMRISGDGGIWEDEYGIPLLGFAARFNVKLPGIAVMYNAPVEIFKLGSPGGPGGEDGVRFVALLEAGMDVAPVVADTLCELLHREPGELFDGGGRPAGGTRLRNGAGLPEWKLDGGTYTLPAHGPTETSPVWPTGTVVFRVPARWRWSETAINSQTIAGDLVDADGVEWSQAQIHAASFTKLSGFLAVQWIDSLSKWRIRGPADIPGYNCFLT